LRRKVIADFHSSFEEVLNKRIKKENDRKRRVSFSVHEAECGNVVAKKKVKAMKEASRITTRKWREDKGRNSETEDGTDEHQKL
jgi:hypothetical protein